MGKANVYEFVKNEFAYQVFVHYVTKKRLLFKQKHNLLYKRLYEFIDEIKLKESVILFGSYAKGTETGKSDIDLLLITRNKNVEKIARMYETKYNITIRPVVVAPLDFKNIKRDNPAFWEDLIEHSIILDGVDFFFREVYK